MQSTLWFKNKKYGWGWTPANKWGWVSLCVYVLAVTIYPIFSKEMSVPIFFGIIGGSTAALIFLCYKKGEAPRWNWGDDQ